MPENQDFDKFLNVVPGRADQTRGFFLTINNLLPQALKPQRKKTVGEGGISRSNEALRADPPECPNRLGHKADT